MQNNPFIKSKVEETLGSLDNIKRASPKPFFYTRLSAALNRTEQNFWERLSAYIIKPSTVFAGICLIILMNIIAAYTNLNTPAATEQAEINNATTDEYSQVATNFYDLENIKP